jgi:hypothetical protein
MADFQPGVCFANSTSPLCGLQGNSRVHAAERRFLSVSLAPSMADFQPGVCFANSPSPLCGLQGNSRVHAAERRFL